MKRIIAGIVAIAALATMLVIGSTAASATSAPAPQAPVVAAAQKGPLCTYSLGVICGRITNATNIGIGIIPNWGPDWQNGYGGGGWKAILQPGQNSSSIYQDTDGIHSGQCWMIDVQVFTRYGWKTQARLAGERNYKIPDTNTYRVVNARRYC